MTARHNLRKALLEKGAKAVKGKQLYPHEIAQKCMRGNRNGLSTLEADLMHAQWEAMREGVKEAMAAAAEAREAAVAEAAGEGAPLEAVAALRAALPKPVDLGKLVPLIDVSGSMVGTPMEAAIGLGLVVAELSHPAFRNRAITFESSPQWVHLDGAGKVASKVRALQGASWGGSTDFEAACELVLGCAERARLKPDEVPDLIVCSDMQFNEARGAHCMYGRYGGGRVASWETHHERLTRRFAEVGRAVCGEPYAAPRIIYWNLRGNTAGFPVQADAPNTQMLSGFSPSLLKLVLAGKDLVGDEKQVRLPDGTVLDMVVRVKDGSTYQSEDTSQNGLYGTGMTALINVKDDTSVTVTVSLEASVGDFEFESQWYMTLYDFDTQKDPAKQVEEACIDDDQYADALNIFGDNLSHLADLRYTNPR